LSAAPIFCKFGHNATLHAEGNAFRVYFNADQGYRTSHGHNDFKLDRKDGPIISAVNVSELVCHVMTMGAVYEVNAEHGLVIRRIANKLPAAIHNADPYSPQAAEEIARLNARIYELERWQDEVRDSSALVARLRKAEAELAAMKAVAA
jgi:hypothetical protein